jgi:hypothetical protein
MFCDFSRTKHLTAGAMLPSFARQLQDQFYWNLKNALVTASCRYFGGRRLAQTPYNSGRVRPGQSSEEEFHVKFPEFCVVCLLPQHNKM